MHVFNSLINVQHGVSRFTLFILTASGSGGQ